MNVYGGYQNVDLKGTALSGTATTIAGVYEAIKNSNGKLLYNRFIPIDNLYRKNKFNRFLTVFIKTHF